MVRGANENTQRFHNPALASPQTAVAFIEREWQSQAVGDRYDWLFTYCADTVEI
jgi:salicylate hydroxylase